MDRTRNSEMTFERTKSIIDVNDQNNSAKHGAEIKEEVMLALFGKEFLAELNFVVKEGPGEAAYIKGGRFSQAANFPLLRINGVEKKSLGDIDTKLMGRLTVNALRERNPGRELRYQIAKTKLSDGQEVDYQDCEKMRVDMLKAADDAIIQCEGAHPKQSLTEEKTEAYTHAKLIKDTITTDFEKALLSAGLVRAKEAAIKVVKTPQGLKYTLCDPNNSLGDPEIFDRERSIHDLASSTIQEPVLTARTLPNISELSVHRLVMEMTTAFGHFETESPIVMSTMPLAMNIIKGDIYEMMLFAADGLSKRTSSNEVPPQMNINRALESFTLIKDFIAATLRAPQFSDLSASFVNDKTGFSDLASYNIAVVKKSLLESLEADAKTTLFYAFSYLPALAQELFPTIDKFAPIAEYHRNFDPIDQNMLDLHLYFDPSHDSSSYLREHHRDLSFLINIQELTEQVFPQAWSVAIEGQQPRNGPGIIKQQTESASVAIVIAILLRAAGRTYPSSGLLTQISQDWGKSEYAKLAQENNITIDCDVTPGTIRSALKEIETIELPA